ncbi:hypothetical protein MASR2M17_13120 [Aminivibrio sp.]
MTAPREDALFGSRREEAIHAAINDYRREKGLPVEEEEPRRTGGHHLHGEEEEE